MIIKIQIKDGYLWYKRGLFISVNCKKCRFLFFGTKNNNVIEIYPLFDTKSNKKYISLKNSHLWDIISDSIYVFCKAFYDKYLAVVFYDSNFYYSDYVLYRGVIYSFTMVFCLEIYYILTKSYIHALVNFLSLLSAIMVYLYLKRCKKIKYDKMVRC